MTYSKLGTDTKTGETVNLYKTSRRQGTYIIAATGVGKSTSLRYLIEQDIKQGIGVCVFDPHGDLIDDIIGSLHRKEDRDRVILLDAQDQNRVFGINLYQCDNPRDKKAVEDTVERVRHLIELFWPDISTQPLVSQGIRNSSYAFIDSSPVYGCTMLELPLLFGRDKALRTNIVSHLQDTTIAEWWHNFESFDQAEKAKRSDMVVNKIEEYTTNRLLQPIIGQSRSTIDFREVIDSSPGKIVLVRMYGDNERMTQLIGAMVIAQLLGAALSRQGTEREKRRQFHLYCDEFELYATDDFTRLLKECRKYGMGMTIAHQSREGISLRNKAASLQVANIIVGRVIPDDAKDLAPLFKANPKPGEPEYKPIMERQFQTYIEHLWEPPGKQQEYEQLLALHEKLASVVLVLAASVDWLGSYFTSPCEPSAGYELLLDKVRLEGHSDEQLLWEFYRFFNPDFGDVSVQEYLLSQVYKRGSTLQNPRLRNSSQLEYRFPPSLPSLFEKSLRGWFDQNSQAPQNRFALMNVEHMEPERQIALHLAAKLPEIKAATIYRFDESMRPYILDPGRQEREEAAFWKKWEELHNREKEFKRAQRKWREAGKWFGGIGRVGIRLPTAKEWETLEAEIEALRKQRETWDRQMILLKKERARQSYGYWPIVPMPEVKKLFLALLYWIDQEQHRLFYTAEEIKRKHYITKETKIDLGYYHPVYDYTPKFTASYDMRFGRGGLEGGIPSSLGVSTERTQRYEEKPGPEEPFSNAWNRTVDELVHLPVGVAWCRVQNAAGELEEHVIKLAMSTTRVANKITIEQYIEEIKERMLDSGYLRPITDVEQEIADRHARLRQPQAQPVLPDLPDRPQRKKPI